MPILDDEENCAECDTPTNRYQRIVPHGTNLIAVCAICAGDPMASEISAAAKKIIAEAQPKETGHTRSGGVFGFTAAQRRGQRKFPLEIETEIRRLHNEGTTVAKLAEKFGASLPTIYKIVRKV